MSLNNNTIQNCPHCKTEQDVTYYQSVNVTLQPDLKDKVMSGKLNTNICTNCNKEIDIVSGLLYHDMINKLMIELSFADENDEDEDGKAELMQSLIKQGYIYRKVSEYGRLIEKITIFDNQLNDLVVQNISNKMKEILDSSSKEFSEGHQNINFTVVFNKIEKGLFKKKISFHCFSHPSQIMSLEFDLKELDSSEKKNLYNMDMLRV